MKSISKVMPEYLADYDDNMAEAFQFDSHLFIWVRKQPLPNDQYQTS